MFHLLKHTVIRLWLALMIGGPASIGLLTLLQEPGGPGWPMGVTAAVLAAVFVLLGWCGNRLGRRSIHQGLADGGVWERAGRYGEAETALRKAVAVYDSFLISPLARRRLASPITLHLARLHLARPDKDDEGLASVRSYLDAHPHDRTVAEAWLRWLERQDRFEPGDEALADRIAEAQPEHLDIQRMLGRRCLDTGRTDFQALEIYRRVMGQDARAAEQWTDRLAVLFLNEGRADQWALALYLAAWGRGDQDRLRRGLAACVRFLTDGEASRAPLEQARGHLKGLDAVDLEILSEGFKTPVSRPAPNGRRVGTLAGRLLRGAGAAVGGLGLGVARASRVLWYSRSVRRTLAGCAVAGAAAAAGLLLVNTVGHLLQPAPPETVREKSFEIAAVIDPYTIQVAAYLKREHAENYVTELRGRQIDAHWKEARGKNKIWYQVRISHFPDKASALAYGEALKRRELIEDFYVANYDPP